MDFLILKLQQFGEWPYISWIYDNKTSVSVSFISNFLRCKNNAWKKKIAWNSIYHHAMIKTNQTRL